MAIFAPATGGTVVSTSWEAAAIELAELLQGFEETANAGATNPINRVAVNYDSGIPKTAQIQINLPITLEVLNGSPRYVPTQFISPVPNYLGGAGDGDLKSLYLESAVYEAFSKLQALEKAVPPAGSPTPANNVAITVNTEALLVSITANLPIEFTVVAGKPTINAVAYL